MSATCQWEDQKQLFEGAQTFPLIKVRIIINKRAMEGIIYSIWALLYDVLGF
jgi:hypothetical protein